MLSKISFAFILTQVTTYLGPSKPKKVQSLKYAVSILTAKQYHPYGVKKSSKNRVTMLKIR